MAVRGRKPKPTAVKMLEGNPGKRKLNENELNVVKLTGDVPSPPSWLLPDAKKEWKRLAKNLSDLGVLTNLDLQTFASYCQAYARWKDAERKIAERGNIIETKTGYLQQNPLINISQSNQKVMLRTAAEFGLTPSARARIIAGQESSGSGESEMEKILRGEA